MTDKPTECANGCPEKQVCDYCQSMDAALRLIAVNREVVELQERIRQLEAQSVPVVGEPVAWMVPCQTVTGDVDFKLSYERSGVFVGHSVGDRIPLYTAPSTSITAAEIEAKDVRIRELEEALVSLDASYRGSVMLHDADKAKLEALRKDAERAAYAADNAAAPTAATGVEVVAVPHGFLSDVLTAAGLLWSGGRCKALGERLSDAYSQIRATDLDAMREDRDAAHEVLRSLACWLSVGGYNAEEVNAAEFERKIRDGVAMLTAPLTQQIDALRARLEQAEKDAERYRWLKPRLRYRMQVSMTESVRPALDVRNGCAFFDAFTPLNDHWEKNQAELESAIDAAIQERQS